MTFDSTGSTIVATCRDRKLRMFDARSPESVQTVDGHGGIKGARVVWCGDKPRFVTTGFSKMSERQMFLWDATNVSKPLKTVSLDSSNGIIMPFWSDNNIIFLAGKGDGNVRYYELESDELYYLSEYKSIEPQSGMAFLPRRSLNVDENEIARAYKVTNGMIQPVSFYVPRRSETFQSDIFPPAPSGEPAMTASQFFDEKLTKTQNKLNFENRSEVPSIDINAIDVSLAKSDATTEANDGKIETAGKADVSAMNVDKLNTELARKEESIEAAPAEDKEEAATAPGTGTENESGEKEARDSIKNKESTVPTQADAKSHDTQSEASLAPATEARAESVVSHKGLEELRAQLAERDVHIRELEMENETYVYYLFSLHAGCVRIRNAFAMPFCPSSCRPTSLKTSKSGDFLVPRLHDSWRVGAASVSSFVACGPCRCAACASGCTQRPPAFTGRC